MNEISAMRAPVRLQNFTFIREFTQGKIAINECDIDFRLERKCSPLGETTQKRILYNQCNNKDIKTVSYRHAEKIPTVNMTIKYSRKKFTQNLKTHNKITHKK